MAKITRSPQQIFGSAIAASNHISKFGSLKAGSIGYSLDPADIQTPAYLNGWEDALQSNKAPPLQDLNALFFLLSRQIAYTMQAGVPEWDAATEYHIGSVVSEVGTGVRYVSKEDNNTGNALTVLAKWERESTGLPFGSVIATFPNLTGAYACTATTVADAKGFVQCNGQTLADATSPMNGQVIPNINNDVFLMGNATSGTAGGANTKTVSVSGNLPNHLHTLDANGGAALFYAPSSLFTGNTDPGPTYSYTRYSTFTGVTNNIVSAFNQATSRLVGTTNNPTSSPAIASTGSNDIRPSYITARFVMRVK